MLTSAARAYFAGLSPAFDRLASATERYGRDVSSELRVNAPSTFALRWPVPRLAEFQQRFPDVRVRLETSNEGLEALRESYDVIIRGGPDVSYDFSATAVLSENRRPVCSAALLDRLALRSVQDLQQHTLLHSSSLPRAWDDWLSKAGAADLRPTALVSNDLAQGRLVAPFDGPLLPARSYCAHLSEAAETQSLPVAFRSWLGQEGNMAREMQGNRPIKQRARAE